MSCPTLPLRNGERNIRVPCRPHVANLPHDGSIKYWEALYEIIGAICFYILYDPLNSREVSIVKEDVATNDTKPVCHEKINQNLLERVIPVDKRKTNRVWPHSFVEQSQAYFRSLPDTPMNVAELSFQIFIDKRTPSTRKAIWVKYNVLKITSD